MAEETSFYKESFGGQSFDCKGSKGPADTTKANKYKLYSGLKCICIQGTRKYTIKARKKKFKNSYM